MEGGKDPDCRRSFQWDKRRWNTRLRDYFKHCIALRKAHPALRRGAYRRLLAQGDIYAFGRRLGDEALVIALNASKGTWPLNVSVAGYLEEGARLQGVWGEGHARVENGRLVGLLLPARSGVVLEVVGAVDSQVAREEATLIA